jgi:hypothetical protein
MEDNNHRPNKKPHRYKGELANPLLAGVYLTDKMTGAELDTCLEQAIFESRVEKLALLMKHYKIADKTDYFSLALELAKDHVPGFRIGRASELLRLRHGDHGVVLGNKRGRPREWTPERSDRLVDAVEETKKRYRYRTDREALENLARHKEWSRPAKHRGGFEGWIKTLRNRLQEARQNRLDSPKN